MFDTVCACCGSRRVSPRPRSSPWALAVVGIYGVIAYSVCQRTREFGIRMALGDSKTSTALRGARQNIRLIAWGLAIGLVAEFELTRFMADLLYGIGPRGSANPDADGNYSACCGSAGELYSGPPRLEGGPDGDAALRMRRG